MIELDPLIDMGALRDVAGDVDLGGFHLRHPTLDGSGVKVAVLDGGIDTRHPFLNVSLDRTRNVTGEGLEVPSLHATHCAGVIASTHAQFSGIAPGVELFNIKATLANRLGSPGLTSLGIDRARDVGARILSISLGTNHIPLDLGGDGWPCAQGLCLICDAVDTAAAHGHLVVVAAGNEHVDIEHIQDAGGDVPSEIRCPGQARGALTVGALKKTTFMVLDESSRGPTADDRPKPDLWATGVGVVSTTPVPPGVVPGGPGGIPDGLLFGALTGTSVATPMVAGALALVIQRRAAAGLDTSREAVLEELFAHGVEPLVEGAGLPTLTRLTLHAL
ncbi:MAG: S8 family serine peptidase [Thermoanaerobaculia bacterium]